MSLAQGLSPRLHRSEAADSIARRRGGLSRRTLVTALLLTTAGLAAVLKFAPLPWGTVDERPLVGTVAVGEFVHEIVERGEVQSSNNVEVRCEVQMRSSNTGTAIIEIVPEGTLVEEGDFLVRLDDAALQYELQLQQIDCTASQASVVQAQTAVETAELTLAEYVSGTFKQEEETLQSEIFVAEENLRRALEYLKYSERLAAKGYVTPIQLEADRFAVDKAGKELDVAETKLEVLGTYTKQKMIKQLEAALRTAEAHLEAARETDSVEQALLRKIKQQIAKCIISAPTSGQVVYANDSSSRSGEDIVLIEEGRIVRERQILIRLPNPQKMQVTAKINEARIDLVKPGMTASVRVDALPGVVLSGRVRRVSEYPMQQSSSYTAHIKEYATEIDILSPPAGIRPGMTAQAAIVIERRDTARQVPLQAVIERDGRYYCLVHTPAGTQARQVQVGPTNDKFVVIEEGLQGDEQVLMAPQQHVARVALPAPVEFAARPRREYVPALPDSATKVAAVKTSSSAAKKLIHKVPASTADAVVAPLHGAGL